MFLLCPGLLILCQMWDLGKDLVVSGHMLIAEVLKFETGVLRLVLQCALVYVCALICTAPLFFSFISYESHSRFGYCHVPKTLHLA